MAQLLFIQQFIDGDLEGIKWRALAVTIMAIMVLLASAIDLYYGIKASKAAGMFQTTSYGVRKTIDKDSGYMIFFTFAVMLDACLSFFTDIPACTVVIALSEIAIEAMSVMENRKRIGMSGQNPLDVARAVIKTFGISDAKKIEEVINYIKEQEREPDAAKDIEPLDNTEL